MNKCISEIDTSSIIAQKQGTSINTWQSRDWQKQNLNQTNHRQVCKDGKLSS